ncbi:MAG: leucyl aminopeptidase [Actinobacteria bacterium]|nr:leucyl aminopeptidase [Actinomycetota bacterium]
MNSQIVDRARSWPDTNPPTLVDMHNIELLSQLPTAPYQLAIPFETEDSPQLQQHGVTKEDLAAFKAEPKKGNVARLAHKDGVLLLVGGKQSVRDFAANATRAASTSIPLVFEGGASVSEIIEGVLLATATPTRYKTPKDEKALEVKIIGSDTAALEVQTIVAEEILAAREIINMPANDLYPEALAALAAERAKTAGVEIEIWDEKRSLKPADSMVGMKYDMAGAATVMAATMAIARLKLKVDITTVMCIAENMPSGQATRPGDVVKIRGGKTVEVLNTDAEGRLVLADGLRVLSELKPDHLVDVATLTGAATIALGKRYSGLMGHGPVVEKVLEAAKQSEELVWHMPLAEELRSTLDSELADMTNVKIGNRAGGMIVGGLFLEKFVDEDASWAHLDIASAANNDGAPYSVYPSGATGVMVRTLVNLAGLI